MEIVAKDGYSNFDWKIQIIIGCVFSLLLVGLQLIVPIWLIAMLPLIYLLCICTIRTESISFFLFTVLTAIIEQKTSQGGEVTGFVIVTAAIFTSFVALIILKRITLPEFYSINSTE